MSIADFAGGSKALQAVVGGSADVVSGAFEHTLAMQSKGQFYRAFALQGRAPMIGVGVSKKAMPGYKGPADLKGKKIGVTAPGSSTNMVVNFFLARHGLKASDVSIIGVGAGAGAVTALRSGQIDAISNTDPVVSMLEMPGEIQIIVDTRTLKDTQAIFGGNMPAGCLYAPQAFIDANPNTTQALANALVRADKWIQKAGPDEIAKVVPESYLLGDPAVYKTAISKSLEGLSPDGLIPEDGAATALKALAAYQADFDAAKIDASKVWTNDFARPTRSTPMAEAALALENISCTFAATTARNATPRSATPPWPSRRGVRVRGRPHRLRQVHLAERRRRPAGAVFGAGQGLGQPLSGINARAGYMFQGEALLPWRSALDNVMAGLDFAGVPRQEGEARGREWMRRVGLGGFEDRYPHQMSGGMRKRVMLAQTLIRDPDIILMDEPFSALDIQTRQLMENEVLDLWMAKRKAVLFITHDLDEAIAMSDRVVVLSAGPGTHPIGEFAIDRRVRATWPRCALIRVSSSCTPRSGACCARKCSRAMRNKGNDPKRLRRLPGARGGPAKPAPRRPRFDGSLALMAAVTLVVRRVCGKGGQLQNGRLTCRSL